MDLNWVETGRFRALLQKCFDTPEMRAALADLPSLVEGSGAAVLQAGRHLTVRVRLAGVDVVAKRFGRQSIAKDAADRFVSGSKALRTFLAARHMVSFGIGTTPPVAVLERWRGPRLAESYFVSLLLTDHENFKDRLVAMCRRGADYSEFASLLRNVANAVRRLHDSGCVHNDLGNQNIELVRRSPLDDSYDVAFLDLNRARFSGDPDSPGVVSMQDRARDLSRLALPSAMREEFFRLYWNGTPPGDFVVAERRSRAVYELHHKTRALRHPFRELKYKQNPDSAPQGAAYPAVPDQWIWDSAASRPAAVLTPKSLRIAQGDAARSNAAAVKAAASTVDLWNYEPQCKAANCVTRLVVNADNATIDAELERMSASGIRRALVSFSAAEPASLTSRKITGALKLVDHGARLAIVVQQSRRSIKNPAEWTSFCSQITTVFRRDADWFALGQGVNSPLWGIYNQKDVDALFAPSLEILGRRALPLSTPVFDAPLVDANIGSCRKVISHRLYFKSLTIDLRDFGESDALREIKSMAALFPAINSAPLNIILDEPPKFAPPPNIGEIILRNA